MAVGFLEAQTPAQTPIPNGTVWNMVFDEAAPPGYLPDVTHEEIWQRLEGFLTSIVPVAEEAGVRLAAHPDDPPLPVLRGMARLVTQPQHYQRLLDLMSGAQQVPPPDGYRCMWDCHDHGGCNLKCASYIPYGQRGQGCAGRNSSI